MQYNESDYKSQKKKLRANFFYYQSICSSCCILVMMVTQLNFEDFFQKRFPSPLLFSFVIYNQIHRIGTLKVNWNYINSWKWTGIYVVPIHFRYSKTLNSIAQEPALNQYKKHTTYSYIYCFWVSDWLRVWFFISLLASSEVLIHDGGSVP